MIYSIRVQQEVTPLTLMTPGEILVVDSPPPQKGVSKTPYSCISDDSFYFVLHVKNPSDIFHKDTPKRDDEQQTRPPPPRPEKKKHGDAKYMYNLGTTSKTYVEKREAMTLC